MRKLLNFKLCSGSMSPIQNSTTMRNKIFGLLTAILFLAAAFTACKKDNTSSTDNTTTEASVQSDDQQRVSSETEAVADDADVALEASPSFSGRLNRAQTIICDASVAIDSLSNPRTITITYNGTNCLGN